MVERAAVLGGGAALSAGLLIGGWKPVIRHWRWLSRWR
jgi:hypothetical protein